MGMSAKGRLLFPWARKPAQQKHRAQLRLQSLEERAVPTTYTVGNTNASGAGSLADAVSSANSHPGADSINFDASVFGSSNQTIGVSSELAVTESVTITGPSVGVTVDGGSAVRVFHISGGSTSVTMSNITVANGKVAGNGAGIFDDSATLTISNCILTSNTATAGDGAGLSLKDAPSVTVTSCTLKLNSASGFGGAMFISDPDSVNGSVSVSLTSFGIGTDSTTYNTARNGGGIYIDSMADTITINTSTIAWNTATTTNSGEGGGGITNDGDQHVTIKNDTINNNSAASDGGGIFYPNEVANDTTYNIQNTTIAFNTADLGGGVFIDAHSNGTTDLHIYNSTITGNTAANKGAYYEGGGIGFVRFKKAADSILIESTIVASNTAKSSAKNIGPDIGGESTNITAIHCLIGVADDGGWSLSGSSSSNQDGTKSSPQDPGFDTGLLANNGGPTQTIALASGSTARENGDNVLSLDYDQRGSGYNRLNHYFPDIGAYEYQQLDD
jgi:hypothetical protein